MRLRCDGAFDRSAGLDRFGRAIDLKFTDYNGSPVEFDRRKYTHDRNGNPTGIENTVFKGRSQVFGYDDLNRLVSQDEGIVVGGSIALSELERSYNMDLLGNLVASAGGFKQNSASATFTHAVNATNELTTITRGNPAGRSRLVLDDFASSLSALWSQEQGDWSISGGKVNVDAKDGFPISVYMTRLMGSAVADDGSLEAKTTLPSGGGNAGLIFSKAGSKFWSVSITDGSSSNILLESFIGSGLGQVKASTSATISVSTEYTIRVVRNQRHVDVTIFDGASVIASLAYDSPVDFGDGTFGMWSAVVDAQFDDFSFTRLDQMHAPAAPRFASTAQGAKGGQLTCRQFPRCGGRAACASHTPAGSQPCQTPGRFADNQPLHRQLRTLCVLRVSA